MLVFKEHLVHKRAGSSPQREQSHWEAEEQGGLAAIPTVSPGWPGSMPTPQSCLSFPLEDASLLSCAVVGRDHV